MSRRGRAGCCGGSALPEPRERRGLHKTHLGEDLVSGGSGPDERLGSLFHQRPQAALAYGRGELGEGHIELILPPPAIAGA
jgi:hypothetical protein